MLSNFSRCCKTDGEGMSKHNKTPTVDIFFFHCRIGTVKKQGEQEQERRRSVACAPVPRSNSNTRGQEPGLRREATLRETIGIFQANEVVVLYAKMMVPQGVKLASSSFRKIFPKTLFRPSRAFAFGGSFGGCRRRHNEKPTQAATDRRA